MAPMMAPPGAPSLPAQLNPIPRPPGSVGTTVPGSIAAPTSSNDAPLMITPPLYQANAVASTGEWHQQAEAMIVSMPTLKLLRLIISPDLLVGLIPYLIS